MGNRVTSAEKCAITRAWNPMFDDVAILGRPQPSLRPTTAWLKCPAFTERCAQFEDPKTFWQPAKDSVHDVSRSFTCSCLTRDTK
jgi:hypothetical protein